MFLARCLSLSFIIFAWARDKVEQYEDVVNDSRKYSKSQSIATRKDQHFNKYYRTYILSLYIIFTY